MSKSFVDLGPLPTLKKYLERVGAEPKSFRRYVVEADDGNGYRKEIGSVTVGGEGDLKLWGDVAEPAKEELAAIKVEVASAAWPKPKPGPLRDLPEQLRSADPESLFQFLSDDGKHILFLQQRIDGPNGKQYLPWSYWTDDVWRNTEPDGLLPLYGLDKIDNHTTVFIHEGAKAARHCQWLKEGETKTAREARDAHPWSNELQAGAHLGWAGGAPNPHRTDWSVLKRAGIKQIIVVADNDHLGQEAVRKISRLTLLPMTAVLFDDNFKPGFDLADPWPDATAQPDWWTGKRYLGPPFHDMCKPATWATRKVMTGERGRPTYVLRDDFIKQWALSQEPHLFVHREYAYLLMTPEVFNRTVAPYSDVEDVATLLANHVPPHAEGITYRPRPAHMRQCIINSDGRRLINTYRPPAIIPARGDIGPFLEFMEYVFPDPHDRFQVMRWCATLIARPQIHMHFSLLLISETQGVGKTTLSDSILKPLVGPWNVSSPSEEQIVNSQFNAWSAQKRLATINEIYTNSNKRAYNRLKKVITDPDIDVNRKFREEYTVDNYLHVVACSNSNRALHLDDEDRRFLVPAVAETLKPKEWWVSRYAYLNSGGLSAIAQWAEDFVLEHGPVLAGERAPETARKRELIADMRSDGAKLAYDLARMVLEAKDMTAEEAKARAEAEGRLPIPTGEAVLRLDEVESWVAKMRQMDANSPKMESKATLSKAMVAAGLMRPARPADLGPKDKWEPRIPIMGRPTEVLANYRIEGKPAWGTKEVPGLIAKHRKPDQYMPVPL